LILSRDQPKCCTTSLSPNVAQPERLTLMSKLVSSGVALWVTVLLTALFACDPDAPNAGPGFDAALAFDATQPTSKSDARAAQDADAAHTAEDAHTDTDASQPSDAGVDATADLSRALSFDGMSYVNVRLGSGGPSEIAFTAEVWFRTTETVGNMFEIYDTQGGGSDRFLYTQRGSVCFYVYGPESVCSTRSDFNDGMWHHAAGTVGPVGGQRVYVDGMLAGVPGKRVASTFVDGNALRVGYGHFGFGSPIVYFKGAIDEVRLWSVERSAMEINASYRTHLPSTTPGLEGYWAFDETGLSTTAHNEVASGPDGILTGFKFAPSPWTQPGAF
jgi:Concanavalin A-like lectin/glucanases superfamily